MVIQQSELSSPLNQIPGLTPIADKTSVLSFPFAENKVLMLNHLYHINISPRDVTINLDSLKDDILTKVAVQKTLDETEVDKRKSFIKDKMDWVLENDKGSFITRLSAFMHKYYKVNLTPAEKADIDSAIKEHYITGEYHFDIDVSLHWIEGEFGDYDSCFFRHDGEDGWQFSKLRKTDGYYSIRFFKPYKLSSFPEKSIKYLQTHYPYSFYIEGDTIYRGYARNWMRFGVGINYPIIFNSYGHPIKDAARVVMKALGDTPLVITPVSVANTGIYNNGDGMMIHPPSAKLNKTNGWSSKPYYDCSVNKERIPFLVTEEAVKKATIRLESDIKTPIMNYTEENLKAFRPGFHISDDRKVMLVGKTFAENFAKVGMDIADHNMVIADTIAPIDCDDDYDYEDDYWDD